MVHKQRRTAKLCNFDAPMARLNIGSCSLTQNKRTLFKCRLKVDNVFPPDTELLNDMF